MKIIILLSIYLFIYNSPGVYAYEIEGMAVATSTQFEDLEDYNTTGASARYKINFFNDSSGYYLHNISRGGHILLLDAKPLTCPEIFRPKTINYLFVSFNFFS